MYLITLYAIALGFASTQIFALPCTDTPASPLSNETFGLWVRDVPQRPEGVHPATFHASVFEQFDQNSKKISGMFDINHPAAIHAPVFLYARINPSTDPCYPDRNGGVDGARPDAMNPGLPRGGSTNPGENCQDPSPYKGAYTPGDAFPVYVAAAYCDGEWRINYNVYYQHDGSSHGGHTHDWEGISVIFKRDPKHPEADWYMATGAIYNRHAEHDYYDWSELETVFGDDDVREEKYGHLKKHPKAYVGFYSHSAYRNRCDSGKGCSPLNFGPDKDEYRSNDWYRMVHHDDLRLYDYINGDWNYGDATSTPWYNHNNMCGWKIGDGPHANPPADFPHWPPTGGR